MPRTKREFIKVEVRVLNDHRFFTLSEREQLIYIKLLLIMKQTKNKIPKKLQELQGYLRMTLTQSEIRSIMNRIKRNFPKFNETRWFYYFDNYDELYSYGTEKGQERDNVKNDTGGVDKDIDKDIDKDKDKELKEIIYFCFDTKNWQGIKNEDLEGWQKTYPACNIQNELDRMADWLLSNPDKKKKNYRRFISNWLMRCQDKGGSTVRVLKPKPKPSDDPPEKLTPMGEEARLKAIDEMKRMKEAMGKRAGEVRK